jgi:C4-dicarboxylate-specific signal transduction histidine kinase
MSGPLTYAMLNLHGLEDGAGAEQTAEALAAVREGLQRMSEMVSALRTLARSDSTIHQPTDVKDVIEMALRMSSVSHRAHARVLASLRQVSPVLADAPQLAQVFVNLLINAADAVKHVQDRERTVSVELSESGGEIVVVVRDSGEGMAPEVVARAFEPFFTTKPGEDGMGLGLAICRSIVEDLHGTIAIESTTGVGTSVKVSLPAASTAARST